jgi:hypothetical protein
VYTAAALATAQLAGWKKTKKKYVKSSRFIPTKRKRPVFVNTNGINRAWMIHVDLYNAIQADLQALGVNDCDPDTPNEYAWGCTYPMPAVAVKIVNTPVAQDGSGGGSDTFRTFVDDARRDSLPAGYVLVSDVATFATT